MTGSVIKRTKAVINKRLKPGMVELAKEKKIDFKTHFGTRFFAGISYGGAISLVYCCNTKSVETRTKIQASLEAAKSGSGTFNEELSRRGVSIEMTSELISAGGDPTGPATDVASAIRIMNEWKSTVKSDWPVYARVEKYGDAFPGFPDLRGEIIIED